MPESSRHVPRLRFWSWTGLDRGRQATGDKRQATGAVDTRNTFVVDDALSSATAPRMVVALQPSTKQRPEQRAALTPASPDVPCCPARLVALDAAKRWCSSNNARGPAPNKLAPRRRGRCKRERGLSLDEHRPALIR
ncbi:hypothetical protein SVAN01_08046 [Stagonosporopsis vannaccii]|nr:hypothetical protein SVAN01_08046 [Stagonosporopsis vannaccii]